jgi:hypothetical protein
VILIQISEHHIKFIYFFYIYNMSVTFTSTLVDTLEAFIYYNSSITYQPGPQPFNNSPDNVSAEQNGYVTGNAQDGITVNFINSYVSIQGTDSNGNIYYWVSFNIDPSSTQASKLKTIQITEPNTTVDLDTKQYFPLYACNNGTQCPDGLACFNDPITKKSYCAGIGKQNISKGVAMIIILVIIILVIISLFLTFKLFHVIFMRK